MIDPNKKFNIILGMISIAFIIASILMFNIISRREESRNYFKFNAISDIKWINEEDEFRIDTDNVYLKVNGEVLIDAKFKEFETDTGKIITNNESCYLKSVSSSNLIIWYDNVEYKFIKYIETK